MNERTPQPGRLVDRATQVWVRATGRAVTLEEHPWLEGPVGDVDVIGTEFFQRYAKREGLDVISSGVARGIVGDLAELDGPDCARGQVDDAVARFYEQTSAYDFDVWSEWSRLFRPFGGAVRALFGQRLQQLNVPLSSLENRLGIASEVLHLRDQSGEFVCAAWVRETISTGRALYVGSYSLCKVPGFDGPCLKVAFPLPNGYALVIMRPESHADGSITIHSHGRSFGDPGFYFFVEQERGRGWARYVRSLKESIHVYSDAGGVLRADHDLVLWGRRFLRLHYRMNVKAG